MTIGGFFACFTGMMPDEYEAEVAIGSPFYGPVYALDSWTDSHRFSGPTFALAWIAFYSASAALLFLATLASFDRCLGRSRGRRPEAPARPARRLRRSMARPYPGSLPEVASHALQE